MQNLRSPPVPPASRVPPNVTSPRRLVVPRRSQGDSSNMWAVMGSAREHRMEELPPEPQAQPVQQIQPLRLSGQKAWDVGGSGDLSFLYDDQPLGSPFVLPPIYPDAYAAAKDFQLEEGKAVVTTKADALLEEATRLRKELQDQVTTYEVKLSQEAEMRMRIEQEIKVMQEVNERVQNELVGKVGVLEDMLRRSEEKYSSLSATVTGDVRNLYEQMELNAAQEQRGNLPVVSEIVQMRDQMQESYQGMLALKNEMDARFSGTSQQISEAENRQLSDLDATTQAIEARLQGIETYVENVKAQSLTSNAARIKSENEIMDNADEILDVIETKEKQMSITIARNTEDLHRQQEELKFKNKMEMDKILQVETYTREEMIERTKMLFQSIEEERKRRIAYSDMMRQELIKGWTELESGLRKEESERVTNQMKIQDEFKLSLKNLYDAFSKWRGDVDNDFSALEEVYKKGLSSVFESIRHSNQERLSLEEIVRTEIRARMRDIGKTKKRIENLVKAEVAEHKAMKAEINAQIDRVDSRLTSVDVKLTAKIDKVEERLSREVENWNERHRILQADLQAKYVELRKAIDDNTENDRQLRMEMHAEIERVQNDRIVAFEQCMTEINEYKRVNDARVTGIDDGLTARIQACEDSIREDYRRLNDLLDDQIRRLRTHHDTEHSALKAHVESYENDNAARLAKVKESIETQLLLLDRALQSIKRLGEEHDQLKAETEQEFVAVRDELGVAMKDLREYTDERVDESTRGWTTATEALRIQHYRDTEQTNEKIRVLAEETHDNFKRVEEDAEDFKAAVWRDNRLIKDEFKAVIQAEARAWEEQEIKEEVKGALDYMIDIVHANNAEQYHRDIEIYVEEQFTNVNERVDRAEEHTDLVNTRLGAFMEADADAWEAQGIETEVRDVVEMLVSWVDANDISATFDATDAKIDRVDDRITMELREGDRDLHEKVNDLEERHTNRMDDADERHLQAEVAAALARAVDITEEHAIQERVGVLENRADDNDVAFTLAEITAKAHAKELEDHLGHTDNRVLVLEGRADENDVAFTMAEITAKAHAQELEDHVAHTDGRVDVLEFRADETDVVISVNEMACKTASAYAEERIKENYELDAQMRNAYKQWQEVVNTTLDSHTQNLESHGRDLENLNADVIHSALKDVVSILETEGRFLNVAEQVGEMERVFCESEVAAVVQSMVDTIETQHSLGEVYAVMDKQNKDVLGIISTTLKKHQDETQEKITELNTRCDDMVEENDALQVMAAVGALVDTVEARGVTDDLYNRVEDITRLLDTVEGMMDAKISANNAEHAQAMDDLTSMMEEVRTMVENVGESMRAEVTDRVKTALAQDLEMEMADKVEPLQDRLEELDKRLEDMKEPIDSRINEVDDKVKGVEEAMEKTVKDDRAEDIEMRLSKLEGNMDEVGKNVDKIEEDVKDLKARPDDPPTPERKPSSREKTPSAKSDSRKSSAKASERAPSGSSRKSSRTNTPPEPEPEPEAPTAPTEIDAESDSGPEQMPGLGGYDDVL